MLTSETATTVLSHADRLITSGHLSHALDVIMVYYRSRLKGLTEPNTSRLSSTYPRGDAFVTFLVDRIVDRMRVIESNSNRSKQ